MVQDKSEYLIKKCIYFKIHEQNLKAIFLTKNLNYCIVSSKYEIIFRYADQLTIGDEVLVQGSDKLTNAIVINVSSSLMQGNSNL